MKSLAIAFFALYTGTAAPSLANVEPPAPRKSSHAWGLDACFLKVEKLDILEGCLVGWQTWFDGAYLGQTCEQRARWYRSQVYHQCLKKLNNPVYGYDFLDIEAIRDDAYEIVKAPTAAPTASPSALPTLAPTPSPSALPSRAPTSHPTAAPSRFPTIHPTAAPSRFPTSHPTAAPSRFPIRYPTAAPSGFPTRYPTVAPSRFPTRYPTAAPSRFPTRYPTAVPTQSPTAGVPDIVCDNERMTLPGADLNKSFRIALAVTTDDAWVQASRGGGGLFGWNNSVNGHLTLYARQTSGWAGFGKDPEGGFHYAIHASDDAGNLITTGTFGHPAFWAFYMEMGRTYYMVIEWDEDAARFTWTVDGQVLVDRDAQLGFGSHAQGNLCFGTGGGATGWKGEIQQFSGEEGDIPEGPVYRWNREHSINEDVECESRYVPLEGADLNKSFRIAYKVTTDESWTQTDSGGGGIFGWRAQAGHLTLYARETNQGFHYGLHASDVRGNVITTGSYGQPTFYVFYTPARGQTYKMVVEWDAETGKLVWIVDGRIVVEREAPHGFGHHTRGSLCYGTGGGAEAWIGTLEPMGEKTAEPTEEPVMGPSEEPSWPPTEETLEPTEEPTTPEPSMAPTEEPSIAPTEEPTEEPTTPEPSIAPTEEPIAPSTAPAPASQPGNCDATFEELTGVDVQVTTYTGRTTAEKDASCCNKCSLNAECEFWVRATDNNNCWLKKNVGTASPSDSRRGGFKILSEARSCQHILDASAEELEDGEYDVDLFGNPDSPITVYCRFVNDEAKMSIRVNESTNFSKYAKERLKDGWLCSSSSLQESFDHAGYTSFKEYFLLVDGDNVYIDVDEFDFEETFTSLEWARDDQGDRYSRNVEVGSAGDCYSWNHCASARKGAFKIDLTGTGLTVADSVQWEGHGWGNGGKESKMVNFKREQNGQVISANCGAWCGHCAPTGRIYLEPVEWRRAASSQCYVHEREYDDDNLDNPIFNGGGFIGTMSRTQCQKECLTRKDPRGRSCVAIEMSTHSTDPNTAAKCALAWGCDFTEHWGGGDVYMMPESEDTRRLEPDMLVAPAL